MAECSEPPTTSCREWRGGGSKNGGYGAIRRGKRQWLVHRWVWTVANGPIPAGLHVLHRCDNPPCFRLDHLYLGTHAENMADRTARGRQARGERHGRTKLSDEELVAIRGSAGKTQRQLARTYAVSQATISRILNERQRR